MSITMGTGEWIGFGSADGRIEFDDQATDELNFRDCNVGINIATPSERLHVYGNAYIQYSNAYLRFGDTSGSVYLKMDNSANLDIMKTDGSTSIIRINQNGNVGIGTTSPGATFHVFSGSDPALRVGTTTNYLDIGDCNAITTWDTSGTAAPLKLRGEGSVSIWTFSGGWQERVTVLANGDVGIGTNSPSSKLEVNGDINVAGNDINNIGAISGNSTAITVENTLDCAGDIELDRIKKLIFNADGGSHNFVFTYVPGGTDIRFYRQGSLRLTLDSEGVEVKGDLIINSSSNPNLHFYESDNNLRVRIGYDISSNRMEFYVIKNLAPISMYLRFYITGETDSPEAGFVVDEVDFNNAELSQVKSISGYSTNDITISSPINVCANESKTFEFGKVKIGDTDTDAVFALYSYHSNYPALRQSATGNTVITGFPYGEGLDMKLSIGNSAKVTITLDEIALSTGVDLDLNGNDLKLGANGDMEIYGYYYIGDKTPETGTWRIGRDDDTLLWQRYNGSSWETEFSISPP